VSSPAATAPRFTHRSRVTNGSQGFLAADGRSREARLLRDREQQFAEPMGGLSGLTVAERTQVQAAAALSVRLEEVRCGLARGAPGITDEDLVRLANGLSRAMAAIERYASRRTLETPRRGVAAYLATRGMAAE